MKQSYRRPAASRKRSTLCCSITGYIRYAARISGQADRDAEDYITETLLKALFKFRLDK